MLTMILFGLYYSYEYDYASTESMQLVRADWLNAEAEGAYQVYEGNEWCSISYENKPFITYSNGFASLLDENGNALDYDTGTLLHCFHFFSRNISVMRMGI